MIPTPRDPHTSFGRAPDGRRWELVRHAGGVIAFLERATVAEAHIWPLGGQATIEFWVDGVELPSGLAMQLVGQAFAHPGLAAHRAVLVCLPRENVALLQLVLRHVDNARARDAGLARLVEGSVRDDAVVLAPTSSRSG